MFLQSSINFSPMGDNTLHNSNWLTEENCFEVVWCYNLGYKRGHTREEHLRGVWRISLLTPPDEGDCQSQENEQLMSGIKLRTLWKNMWKELTSSAAHCGTQVGERQHKKISYLDVQVGIIVKSLKKGCISSWIVDWTPKHFITHWCLSCISNWCWTIGMEQTKASNSAIKINWLVSCHCVACHTQSVHLNPQEGRQKP